LPLFSSIPFAQRTSGFAQSGIVRQTEIIIGGKINQPFADKIDNWALGAADFAKMSI